MSNTKLMIKEIRHRKGLKAKEVAEKMGVSQQRFSNWERGVREMNFLEAINLADIFECSLDELAGREWPPSDSKKHTSTLSDAESTLLHRYRNADAPVRAAMEAIASVQRKRLDGVIHMKAPAGRGRYHVIKK